MSKPARRSSLVRPDIPYLYHGYVLRTRPDGGVDLIDPSTGRWFTNPTQRFARWRATFLANTAAMFEQQDGPAPVQPDEAVLFEALGKDDHVA